MLHVYCNKTCQKPVDALQVCDLLGPLCSVTNCKSVALAKTRTKTCSCTFVVAKICLTMHFFWPDLSIHTSNLYFGANHPFKCYTLSQFLVDFVDKGMGGGCLPWWLIDLYCTLKMDTATWDPAFHHMGSRWTESLKAKVERRNGSTALKTMADREEEIRDGWRERERKQWRWKSPKLQDQSHPSTLAAPPRYLRVIWRRTLLSSILSVQLTGEQLKWQHCLGRLYIHSHSHTHRLHTGVTPARHCCEVPSYFSAALYMEGVDRGEHTISWCPNKENWITPGLTSPEATPRLSVPCAVERTV